LSLFSERLINLKKEKNVLQKDIAKTIGLSLRAYQHYEYGEKEPTLGNIVKLASYFQVSSDYLLGLSSSPNPSGKNEDASAFQKEALKNEILVNCEEKLSNLIEELSSAAQILLSSSLKLEGRMVDATKNYGSNLFAKPMNKEEELLLEEFREAHEKKRVSMLRAALAPLSDMQEECGSYDGFIYTGSGQSEDAHKVEMGGEEKSSEILRSMADELEKLGRRQSRLELGYVKMEQDISEIKGIVNEIKKDAAYIRSSSDEAFKDILMLDRRHFK
jgi:transcriptional regulator with XRE-family HTH domain